MKTLNFVLLNGPHFYDLASPLSFKFALHCTQKNGKKRKVEEGESPFCKVAPSSLFSQKVKSERSQIPTKFDDGGSAFLTLRGARNGETERQGDGGTKKKNEGYYLKQTSGRLAPFLLFLKQIAFSTNCCLVRKEAPAESSGKRDDTFLSLKDKDKKKELNELSALLNKRTLQKPSLRKQQTVRKRRDTENLQQVSGTSAVY